MAIFSSASSACPGRVRVDPQYFFASAFANDAEHFLVPVRAKLDLEDRIVRGFLDFPPQDVGLIDADRERAWRGFGGTQSPHLPQWKAGPLAHQVVQRRAHGSACRAAVVDCSLEVSLDALESLRPACRLDDRTHLLESSDHGGGALSVVRIGIRLAPAFDAVTFDMHPHALRACFVARRAADLERVLRLYRERLPKDLHRSSHVQTQLPAASVSAVTCAVTQRPSSGGL